MVSIVLLTDTLLSAAAGPFPTRSASVEQREPLRAGIALVLGGDRIISVSRTLHFILLYFVQELLLCLWLGDDTFFRLDAKKLQGGHEYENMHGSMLAQKIASRNFWTSSGELLVSHICPAVGYGWPVFDAICLC
jgi:hypothetical protein